jgi:hypothetical protein
MSPMFKAALAGAALIATGSVVIAGEAAHPTVAIERGHASPVSGFQVGTLKCKVPGAVGYIIGSEREASCEYRPMAGRNTVDLYMGRIKKIGVDVGATGPSVMAWAVFSKSSDIGPGDLAGKYRGAAASVSAGVGGGANVLIGGSDITVSLQPLSVEGQTGLSLAAGYASLRLDPI